MTRDIVGNIDLISDRAISGWIYDRNDPDHPLLVTAVNGGQVIGSARAELRRDDVLAAGHATAMCGFDIPVSRPPCSESLAFAVDGRVVQLALSPTACTHRKFLLSRPTNPYLRFDVDLARRILVELLNDPTRLTIFRLAHLMHALGKLPMERIGAAMSIGAGNCMHEAYAALRYPNTRFMATDLDPWSPRFAPANLRFEQRDIASMKDVSGEFDLVFSIECLEHIPDYGDAFARMVDLLRPGGYLYFSVPFANEAERRDSALCERELSAHGHVTPGFSEQEIHELCFRNGLEIMAVESMQHTDLCAILPPICETLDADAVAGISGQLCELAMLDIRPARLAADRTEALGINCLARRAPLSR